MATAGGKDIRIEGIEMNLARDVPNFANHLISPNWVQRVDVTGKPGDQTIRPDILLWEQTDWTGGEGLKWYDPNSTVGVKSYWKGGPANTRNPSEIDAPPARSSGTVTANATPNKLMFAPAGGNLYLGAGCDATAGGANHFFQSTDGTTWTSKNAGFVAGDTLTAMTSDGTRVFLSTITGGGVRKHHYFDATDGTNGTFSADTGATNSKFLGMAFLPIAAGGLVFGWTGRVLRSYPVSAYASFPVASTTVYVASNETIPSGTRGDVIAAENSVVFWVSHEGQSFVFEHGIGASKGANPLWRPPKGMVIKAADYALGNVIFLCDYLGKKAVWALSLVSRQPVFLGYIRPTTSLSVADLSSSFGAEMLMLSTGGHLFSYDVSLDAYSEIDDLTSDGGTFAATTTYAGLRVAARYTTTTIKTWTWSGDDGTLSSSGIGSVVQSSAWDFGLPIDDKILVGFHVTSSSLSATDKIVLSYDTNETGSFTDLTALTSGRANFLGVTTLNGAGSDHPSGRLVRYKITTYGAAKCYAVTVEAASESTSETWELALDLRPSSYPTGAFDTYRASVVRQQLANLARLKVPCTFSWGYEFEKKIDSAWPGIDFDNDPSGPPYYGYQDFTVIIDEIADRTSPFQDTVVGVCRVVLRRVRDL